MKTLEELEAVLEERGLAMTIWFGRTMAEARFTVWLFAVDDPELGTFPGSGDGLEEAIEEARDCWDQIIKMADPAPDKPDDPN